MEITITWATPNASDCLPLSLIYREGDDIRTSPPYILIHRLDSKWVYLLYRQLAVDKFMLLIESSYFRTIERYYAMDVGKRNSVTTLPTYKTMMETGFATVEDIYTHAEYLMLEKISTLVSAPYVVERIYDLCNVHHKSVTGRIKDGVSVTVAFEYNYNENNYLVWDFEDPEISVNLTGEV